MRNRIWMVLGGAGLLLAGLVIGLLVGERMPAFAAPTTHHTAITPAGTGVQRYCGIYEQALANNLNVDEKTLEQDNLAAIGTTLDQAVKDGQLTATEETQIKQLLQQVGTQPCVNLNKNTIGNFLQSDTLVMQQGLAARAALVGAVAGALNISAATLESDRQKGQTVAQIAQAQKVPLATVSNAYLAAAKKFLAQAVSSGLITQDQSSYAYQALTTAVGKGTYPLV